MGARSGSPARVAAARSTGSWLPWTVGALVLGSLAGAVLIVAPDSSTGPGEPEQTVAHERALSEVSGCLVTESTGVATKPASEVWAGLQDAAADVQARASFLPLLNAGSPKDQVNALLAQRCTVVLAVGKKPAAAVRSVASAKPPGVRFATAGAADSEAGMPTFALTRDGTRAAVARMFAEVRGEGR